MTTHQLSAALPSFGRLCSASLLVSGTCIGGGMIALPLSASGLGFFPCALIMLLCCGFMTLTALLTLEATLWVPKACHLLTLSKEILGQPGRVIAGGAYLFIGFASLIGYVAGLRLLLSSTAANGGWLTIVLIVCLALLVAAGKRIASLGNAILFALMLGAYLLLLSLGCSKLSFQSFDSQTWHLGGLIGVIPLALTTYSIPGIVPSLVPYLDRNVKALRTAILLGMGLTSLVYVAWLFVVLGNVEAKGYVNLFVNSDVTAVQIQTPFTILLNSFTFFALATSFVGIFLSLSDFLLDGFKLEARLKSRLMVALAIVMPCLLLAFTVEKIFYLAMETTGGIGDALLSGLIPALMVWLGRYRRQLTGNYRLSGGKLLIALLGAFSAGVFLMECVTLVAR